LADARTITTAVTENGGGMRPEDLLARLREILVLGGADAERPSPGEAWVAFKRFIDEPLSSDLSQGSDQFQAEGGRHRGEEGRPYLAFSRTVDVHDDAGEWVASHAAYCEFIFVSPRAESPGAPFCVLMEADLPDAVLVFVEQTEAEPAFRELMALDHEYRVKVGETDI
jgi:hypothetical protein